MTERERQVGILVSNLQNVLRQWERQAGLKPMALTVRGIEPGGPKAGTEVDLQPCPSDPNLTRQVIAEIKQVVAKWEADSDSGLWVYRLSLAWRGEPPVCVPEDLDFRQAY